MKLKTLIALCMIFALSVGIIVGWSSAIYINVVAK